MTATSTPMVDPTRVELRRVAAWTIDLGLFIALVLGTLFATGGVDIESRRFATSQEAIEFCNSVDTNDGRRACSPYRDEAVVVSVEGSANGVWLANTVFYILLQGLTGGSLGKLIMGLRVVDASGRRAGVSKSFVRTFLWVVDAITCGLPVVGGTLMVTKPGHQRFGDRIAGTYVVRKESVGVPVVIPPPHQPPPHAFSVPPPGYAPPGYGPPHGAPPPYPPQGAPVPGPHPPPTWAPAEPTLSDRPPSRPAVDAPDTDGPHWDDDRDTYIQFDRAVDMWIQWDDTAKHWRPIDT